MEHDKIYNCDCIEGIRKLPDECIDLVVTSPPYYNARDYSSYGSYPDYLAAMDSTFRALHRVVKEGRFIAINSSPVIEAREKRSVQSKRYPIPFDLHSLLRDDWQFIDDIIWLKPEGAAINRNGGFYQHRKPLGYKPNVVTEYIMIYRKKTDRLIDWNMRQYPQSVVNASKVDGYERTNVWRINPVSDAVHPAVYPEELAEKVIRYYSYVGDVILDPFMGSGTTAVAAMKLNRHYIGYEISKEYCDIANKRIEQNKDLFTTI